jgi:hypothetical protein
MSFRAQWLTPSPLWNELAAKADKGPFRSPALLRFATDQFIPQLQGVLASKTPEDLRNYIAQPETWEKPAVGLDAASASAAGAVTTPGSGQETAPPPLFKFFQPVHLRFYLVAASLVCRIPGLPDHQVAANQGERTSFVLRRLRPKPNVTGADLSVFNSQTMDEYAWLSTAAGWTKVTGSGITNGEEKLPMSAFQFGANGSRRRLFTGLIPASRRQTYVGGKEIPSTAQNGGQSSGQTGGQSAPADDPRKIDFQLLVLDPWVELVDYMASLKNSATRPVQSALDQAHMGIAQGSALILVDFANYLNQNLPDVWKAVNDPSQAAALGPNQLAFYKQFSLLLANLPPAGQTLPTSYSTLTNALVSAHSHESDFEAAVLPSKQAPGFPTGYAGPMLTDTIDTSSAMLAALIQRPADPTQPRQLQVLAEAALDEVGQAPPVTVAPPAKNPENPQGDDWYIVRCVYEQPQCGLQAPPLISDPSRPFQLASFFDPDAPARLVQVALPVDTTPAALRKYNKNVAFMISDQLGKQMSRVKGLKQLMDGDLADPNGFGLGMICSFSIPIITICAFIVLMIFLVLLNIVFWWLPFFRICFPLPTLKAKGGS